jgi:hypothetical protein
MPLWKEKINFSDFCLEVDSKPCMRGIGMEGFLIKPIQRLPKYVLLLNDYVKHCEEFLP